MRKIFAILFCLILITLFGFTAYTMAASGFFWDYIDPTVEKSAYYQTAVNISKFTDKLLGKNVTTSVSGTNTSTGILQMSDGYLARLNNGKLSDSAIKNIINLADSLDDMDIDFIFVATPEKLDAEDSVLSSYYCNIYNDSSQKIAAEIKSELDSHDIEIIDLESLIPDLKENRYKYFFKTDIHWLPQTGLLAAKHIGEFLNKEHGYGLDLSFFDIENYTVNSEELMLGDIGRSATLIYCEPEEFPILTPMFETNLSVSINGSKTEKTGSLDRVLYDGKPLEISNFYDTNKYEMYALGNKSLITVHNNLMQNGKHVMVIKTSMANVVTPFLACAVEDLDIVDVRRYFDNLRELIETRQPDTVLFIYGVRDFTNSLSFTFRGI